MVSAAAWLPTAGTTLGSLADPRYPPKADPITPTKGWPDTSWLQTDWAAKPTRPALVFHHFLSKYWPDTGNILQNIIMSAAAKEWLLLANIYFSTIIFRAVEGSVVLSRQPRWRSGARSTSSRINPGRLYDSELSHCSSSVPSRLLGAYKFIVGLYLQ